MKGVLLTAVVLTIPGAGLLACEGRASPEAAGLDAASEVPAQTITDAAVPSFCSALAKEPLFCADFDGDRPFVGWINDSKGSDLGVFGEGSIAAFETGEAAGDRAARFTIPALLDSTARSAPFLAAQVIAPPTTFTMSLLVRIGRDLPASGTAATRLLAVSFGKELGYIGLERSAMKTELFVAERVDGSLKGRYADLDHLAIARGWTALTLRVRNEPVDAGGVGEVSATLGGSAATLPLPPSFRNVGGALDFSVGIANAQGPLDGLQIDVDDVLIVSGD